MCARGGFPFGRITEEGHLGEDNKRHIVCLLTYSGTMSSLLSDLEEPMVLAKWNAHCTLHIMDKISDDLNVEMNYTTTGEHVPSCCQEIV
jgi:hypothetical protein